ncbi:MAG: hypothetical protein HY703_07920 [Gemmatimonadetes bacterium]|nr:hypothetical protein [Gemmatimonadota bacterium]
MQDTDNAGGLRYGDLPHLFWDARPDQPIDLSSPVTLGRLLTRADPRTIGRLVSPDALRQQLDSLQIPEHTRAFWRLVLGGVAERTGARNSAAG